MFFFFFFNEYLYKYFKQEVQKRNFVINVFIIYIIKYIKKKFIINKINQISKYKKEKYELIKTFKNKLE